MSIAHAVNGIHNVTVGAFRLMLVQRSESFERSGNELELLSLE